jgi:hypothetical protein
MSAQTKTSLNDKKNTYDRKDLANLLTERKFP